MMEITVLELKLSTLAMMDLSWLVIVNVSVSMMELGMGKHPLVNVRKQKNMGCDNLLINSQRSMCNIYLILRTLHMHSDPLS